MIEIYLKGDAVYQTSISIETMYKLIEDDFITGYIPLTLPDGLKAYIKKSEIVSFNEIDEFAMS